MSRAIGLLCVPFLLNACALTPTRQSPFAGAVAGISTLSADAQATLRPTTAEASLYAPENGAALNLFAGTHVSDYLSVQGNYIWNRNALTLSAIRSPAAEFFEERRGSVQHGFIADGLLYFRNRGSWARPYLSAGLGLVRFESSEPVLLGSAGAPQRPPARFVSTGTALRVAVGIDLGSADGWSFRYTFSETLTANPVSARLSPPARRGLANFQNLFGAVKSF